MTAQPAIRESVVPRHVSVAEADAEIGRALRPFPVEVVPLRLAAGRVLREPVHADRDQPPFDRATMDGVAFRHSDWSPGLRELVIAGIQAAGQPPLGRIEAGQCVEIMTGAVLPQGCDCVIPVEQIAVRDGRAVLAAGIVPRAMQFVHRRGSDRVAGATLLEAGMSLRGPEIAVLASAGRARVRVSARPPIAVVSTGDELVDVEAVVEPHQLRRSNDCALAAGLESRGYRELTLRHVPDDRERLRQLAGELLEGHAVLMLSGGVSMGRYDHVPGVLESLGVVARFHAVRQRPGKPMWFGTAGDGQQVFALPGNPVSALVCLHRYVLPALERAEGRRSAARETVRLAQSVELDPGLTRFLPVRLGDAPGAGGATPVYTNTSGDFTALAGSDGFIELPAARGHFPAGGAAPLYRW
ncbi:MAG TPA: molybdopterin molybdotransferase MoeA [Gammaproteobacteria bacterium]|nr:molybdopterin molybdotransferase MoeA [Gammaproteobacteria bacterium]